MLVSVSVGNVYVRQNLPTAYVPKSDPFPSNPRLNIFYFLLILPKPFFYVKHKSLLTLGSAPRPWSALTTSTRTFQDTHESILVVLVTIVMSGGVRTDTNGIYYSRIHSTYKRNNVNFGCLSERDIKFSRIPHGLAHTINIDNR